jgi:hypothetical protein
MSDVVVGTLSSHHIFEVGGKVSGRGRMPLEHIVEQDGIVCPVCQCMSHKTKLSDAVRVNSPGGGEGMSLSQLMVFKVRAVGCDDPRG